MQAATTIKIQLGVLVYYNVDLIIISLKINLFSSWYSWKIAELALNNNHSLTPKRIGSNFFFEAVAV
jgi:type III secretory pathway component EscS